MSISAINCTPIKPNVSFGQETAETKKYGEVVKATDTLNDTLVKSEDIKTPAQVALSITIAGLTAFAGAKALTSLVTKFFPNAAEKAFGYLRTGANKVKGEAVKLGEKAAEGGKFAKVKLTHIYYNPYDDYLETSFKSKAISRALARSPSKHNCVNNCISLGYKFAVTEITPLPP